jgi:membrane-bound inhibitor of C-type lysozyme
MKNIKVIVVLMGWGFSAAATELTIPLSGSDAVVKKIARYECDANAPALGLPKGSFEVQYFNGAGNNLAVLPIKERSLIFANVVSASGARYASANLIWWEAAGRQITLSANEGQKQTFCRKLLSASTTHEH